MGLGHQGEREWGRGISHLEEETRRAWALALAGPWGERRWEKRERATDEGKGAGLWWPAWLGLRDGRPSGLAGCWASGPEERGDGVREAKGLWAKRVRGVVYIFCFPLFESTFQLISKAFEFILNFWSKPLISLNPMQWHECISSVAKPYIVF